MANLRNDGPVIGDKVDLTEDNNRYYKTIVGDVLADGRIVISLPIYRGTLMHMELSYEYKLAFYRETGRYSIVVRVTGFETKDEVTYALLEQLTASEKTQRREYYRLPENADVLLYQYVEGDEDKLDVMAIPEVDNMLARGRTKDLSVSGLALLTGWECSLGDIFLIVLMLSDLRGSAKPFLVCGEVMRAEQASEHADMYNAGIQFKGMTRDRKEFLHRHILSQQQKRRMQRILVEGS